MKRARVALGILVFGSVAAIAIAGDQTTRIYQKGALYGVVLDSAGKPVKGATVALQRMDGKILGWSTTNAEGLYALPVDPKIALNLYSHHKNLLAQCVDAVGDVAMLPVRAVGNVVTQPGQTVRSAAASVASGTAAPLVGQTMRASLPTPTPSEMSKEAGGAATYTALGGTPPQAPPPTAPGKTTLLVSASGFKSARLQPTAYWMAGEVQSKTMPIGLQAWVETVKIVPAAAKEEGAVQPEALTIGGSSVEPKLAPVGSAITISCQLSAAPDPGRPIRVFAREAGRNTIVELKPAADHKSYTGVMTIDAKASPGETTISIGALRAAPVEVRLDPKKGDPIPEFCKRVDEMSAKKPYAYDPLIMGAVNREDIKITILKATPTAPPKQ